MATKLRRNEKLHADLRRHPDGSGRSSVWLSRPSSLRFVFETIEEPAIDHHLLAESRSRAPALNGGRLRTRPAERPFLLGASGEGTPIRREAWTAGGGATAPA